MASIAVNPHSNDAALRKSGTGTFSSVRSGSTATSVISAASTTYGPQADNASDGSNYSFDRVVMPFDTSGMAGGVATSATLGVYVTYSEGSGAPPNLSIFLDLVAVNLASAPTIATSDWANVVIGTRCAGQLNFVDGGTGAKTFTLNAAGLAAINATGYTTFAVVMGNDYEASANSPDNLAYSPFYTTATLYSSSGTTPPLLTVTYTPATPAAPPLRRRDTALLPFYSFPD